MTMRILHLFVIVALIVAAAYVYDIKFEATMQAAKAEGMPMAEVATAAKQIMKNVHALPPVLSESEELAALVDAKTFLAQSFACVVNVVKEAEGKHQKAKSAMPNKPAILIE